MRTMNRKVIRPVRQIVRNFDSKVKNHGVEKTPITSQLWQMRWADIQKDLLLKNTVKENKETSLLTKSGSESKLMLKYDFKTDAALRDLYVDHFGTALVGKLFQDIDAFAGNIASNHCDDGNPHTRALQLVTASVDEIIQTKPISVDNDLAIVGQVVWVGKSSLDIVVDIHSIDQEHNCDKLTPETKMLSSYFTYVARNRDTGKAALVNKLLVETEEGQAIFNTRQELAQSRKIKKSNVLEGNDAILAIQLTEAGHAAEDMPALAQNNSVLMKSTCLENTVVCQPQNVNIYGRVFGGFIMHRAYDLALSTCYVFAGRYPVFKEVDKIVFRHPVDVGDLLRLKSRVIYSSGSEEPSPSCSIVSEPKVVVEVICQVVSPERASSYVSNTFHFIFGFPKASDQVDGAEGEVSLKKVLATTSEEATLLIHGSKLCNTPDVPATAVVNK